MKRNELHYAIVDHKTDEAKELILSGKFDLDAQDSKGYTALHFASQYKNVEIVDLLLKQGVDVSMLDSWGNTALLRALGPSEKNREIIKMLLDAGVDPYLENSSGNSVVSHVKKIKSHPNRDIFSKYF
ncbi:ankyrin repeat domain-containing protein [Microbulbifer sp. CNSA002]|uniref:ankyrin repeat domain-containing protein n=1 Tax=Microbulbifer sp. CNSA002 TaxID=3373604 RepID=UPI0039B5B1A3